MALTNAMGGYVSQSRTNSVLGAPTGELTLRMPVNQFDPAVSGAERLGHVVSLTTNAHDVTGQVVDLGARVVALEQTRATYLTILGRATTIGATLEVQQRVEDVQQQIEELQGELKVLRNQSADGTLTVDVAQVGDRLSLPCTTRGGIGKAWHTSIEPLQPRLRRDRECARAAAARDPGARVAGWHRGRSATAACAAPPT